MRKLATLITLVTAFRFTIDLLGTPHFQDVEVIQRGLERADGVEFVYVARSSRNFTRLEGIAKCPRKNFMSDLNGLAQERFTVEVEEKIDGTLIITLRKMPPS